MGCHLLLQGIFLTQRLNPHLLHSRQILYLLSPWGRSVNTMELLQFSLVQSLSHVQLFAAPWTAARQASLFITNSQSLLKPMSIESVMTSNHLILCRPLLLLPSIFPSIRVFTNESVLRIRWPKDWLSRLVITSLPRSKRLLISCLQSWSLLTLGIS